MKHLAGHLRSIVVLALVAALAVVTIPQPRPLQAAGGAPVTVLNTPLPVQGTVNAAQSGTWNVGVSGGVSVVNEPKVQLGNGATVNVVNSKSGGKSIPIVTSEFDDPETFGGPAFTFLLGSGTTLTVPVLLPSQDEMSIIEHVGVDITAFTPGQQVKAALLVKTCGGCSAVPFPIVLTAQSFGSTTEFVSSQPMRIVVFPESAVSIKVDRTLLMENTAVAVSFSIRRVPLP